MKTGDGGEPDEMMQMMMRQMPAQQQYAERHAFTLDDLLGLAAAAPAGTNPKHFPARAALAGPGVVASKAPKGLDDKEHLDPFASILREVMAGGTLAEVIVKRFEAEAAKPAGQSVFTKRQYAKLLVNAGLAPHVGKFLPAFEAAQKEKDLEALNLLSRHFLALMGEPGEKAGNLEKAWHAVQAVLAFPDGPLEQKQEALVRAVELAPRVTEKLGQEWLGESFTKKPERGMEILATVGTLVAQGLPTRPFQTDERLNALKLMKTAVDALLKADAQKVKAKEWKPTLTLLAAGVAQGGRVQPAVRPLRRVRPAAAPGHVRQHLLRRRRGRRPDAHDDDEPAATCRARSRSPTCSSPGPATTGSRRSTTACGRGSPTCSPGCT